MNRIDTKLEGVYIIEPKVFGDHRGYFMETWSVKNFEEIGITTNFIQDNQMLYSEKRNNSWDPLPAESYGAG
jgi:dTDP-4-dehydrorhamnose 3,5-epimerase